MLWVVMGPSGSGKSYFVSRMIEQLSKYKQVIIVDDTDYYHTELNVPTVLIEVNHNNYQTLSFIKIIRIAIERGLVIVFESVDLLMEEEAEFLNRLGDVLLKYMKRVTLVIDEAYHFFPRWHYPEKVARLMRGGRKRALDEVLIYQQFSDVDLVGPRQANYIVAFKTLEPAERDKIRKIIGIDVMDKLKPYEFVIKDLRGGAYSIDNAQNINWDQLYTPAKGRETVEIEDKKYEVRGSAGEPAQQEAPKENAPQAAPKGKVPQGSKDKKVIKKGDVKNDKSKTG